MIKKIRDIVGNQLLFTCVALVVFLLDTILYVHDYTGPLLKLFIVWGALVIGLDLLGNRALWKTSTLKWLLLFCAAYLVTTMTNSPNYVGENLKILSYMVIFFIVLYGHNRDKAMHEWKKEVRTVMLTFFLMATILACICFVTFVLSINREVTTADGQMYIGMCDNRLWGVYNPNAGACINVIAILCAIGLWVSTKNKCAYKKVFLIISMIVHYLCLLLTSSRASLYAFILCLGGLIFLFLNARDQLKSVTPIKWILKNVLLTVIVIVALYAVETPVKWVISYIPGGVNRVLSKNDSEEGIHQIELTRKEELENRDGGILTGRTYIWKAGLSALKESPLFGVSKAAIYDCAKDYVDDEQWLEHMEVSLHNVFITVLVASGWVGLALFLVFLFKNFLPMIRVALLKHGGDNYKLYISCMMIVACLLIIELVEARIIYRTEVFNVVFWTICGFAYNYVEIVNKGEANGTT